MGEERLPEGKENDVSVDQGDYTDLHPEPAEFSRRSLAHKSKVGIQLLGVWTIIFDLYNAILTFSESHIPESDFKSGVMTSTASFFFFYKS